MYGSEKKGLPTTYFLTVADEPIGAHAELRHVDFVPLNNVNLSQYIWLTGLGESWQNMGWFMRELPGLLLVLAYLVATGAFTASILAQHWIR